MKTYLFDGPHGIPLWDKAQARGYKKEPVWIYNLTHPELVEELEREYLAAGSTYVLANTFAANGPAVLASSPYTTPAVIKAAMEITNRVIEGTQAVPGIAAGPLSELLEPFGDLTEEECDAVYEEMISTGVEYGAKFAYLQTFMDLNMLVIAAKVCIRHQLPFMASMTFQENHVTMFGNTVDQIIEVMTPLNPMALGVNCAIGPDQAAPIIEEFAQKTSLPLVLKANSGTQVLHGGTGIGCDPVSYADALESILPLLTYVGGCCGCDPAYIKELGKRI